MKDLRIEVGAGTVSAVLWDAPRARACLGLTHGAGAGMHHVFMETAARASGRAVSRPCVARALWRRHPSCSRSAPTVILEGQRRGTCCAACGTPKLLNLKAPEQPNIWIDITATYRWAERGGIARVARELSSACLDSTNVLPVILKDGRFYPYFQVDEADRPLSPRADTVFVLIDTFWDPLDEYTAAIRAIQSVGGKASVCIHDIIPMFLPMLQEPNFVKIMKKALPVVLTQCSSFVSVSRATERTVQLYIEREGLPTCASDGWFHLGADTLDGVDDDVEANMRQIFSAGPVFVSVGTIEPRKGYSITLDAFEMLWTRGLQARLLIIGRPGWMTRALRSRILNHVEFQRRLFWLSDATDSEVAFAYKQCHAVVQASYTEGFGLPVVEAGRAGAPIIASDVEIFREIGGDALVYFRQADSHDLAAKLEASLTAKPRRKTFPTLTWDQSLEQLASLFKR